MLAQRRRFRDERLDDAFVGDGCELAFESAVPFGNEVGQAARSFPQGLGAREEIGDVVVAGDREGALGVEHLAVEAAQADAHVLLLRRQLAALRPAAFLPRAQVLELAPARCKLMAFSSSTRPSWRRAASACRSSGRKPRRTSRSRSVRRSRLPSVASSRRWAFSRRLRNFRIPAASSMIARRSSGRALSTVSSWPCPTITCCWRPMPVSESNSWMSSRRHGAPLIMYSESPVRNSVRVIVTSENSIGSSPAVLSMVSDTSARPSAGRSAVPAKMTSSILAPRSARAPWAPSTQATESTTFDLPDPFGPTTTQTPGSNSSVVLSAKDLKPFNVNAFRNTRSPPQNGRGASAMLGNAPTPAADPGSRSISGS